MWTSELGKHSVWWGCVVTESQLENQWPAPPSSEAWLGKGAGGSLILKSFESEGEKLFQVSTPKNSFAFETSWSNTKWPWAVILSYAKADAGPVPRLWWSPGEGNRKLLQYSCLENPMDRGAWWAAASPWGGKESGMTERLSMHTCQTAV